MSKVWVCNASPIILLSNHEGILDDKLARRCAKVFSLKIRGTLGIIILAKKKGIIKESLPMINKLITQGIYIDRNLLKEIKYLIQEK